MFSYGGNIIENCRERGNESRCYNNNSSFLGSKVLHRTRLRGFCTHLLHIIY